MSRPCLESLGCHLVPHFYLFCCCFLPGPPLFLSCLDIFLLVKNNSNKTFILPLNQTCLTEEKKEGKSPLSHILKARDFKSRQTFNNVVVLRVYVKQVKQNKTKTNSHLYQLWQAVFLHTDNSGYTVSVVYNISFLIVCVGVHERTQAAAEFYVEA